MSGEVAVGRPETLVGRDHELDLLAGVLARAGSGAMPAAVIAGEPGVGKTALLNAAVSMARAAGWRNLTVQGIESESVLAGAGLLSALTPLRSYLDVVPPAQAEALGAALGWGEARTSGDRFLVGAATLSLLAAAASDTPVLLTVDDVQWVDAESAEAFAFAARRLGHDHVVVVATHRLGSPLPVSFDGFDVLIVGGLTPGAARGLLGPAFSVDVVEQLVAATGGNPLALRECQRILTQAQRAGAASLPQMLPVPERLNDTYERDLERLSQGAWRAAVLTAASIDQAAAPVLAALAAEGLDADTCLFDVSEVLTMQDGALTFRHPLLRSTTWQRASVPERRSAHRSLADVVTDKSARVWHLVEATSGHDEALADDLAAVAKTDRKRRGFAAAATAMERSARLTADVRRRGERLAAAIDDAYVAGDVARVRRLATELLGSAAEDSPRARVLVTLGMLELHYGVMARAKELFEQAAEVATGRLLLQALCQIAHACHYYDDTQGMAAAADRAAQVADRTDPEQAMLAAYLTGTARVVEGQPELGAPLLRQAIDLLESDPSLRDEPRHMDVAFLCARWLMDPSTALGYAERRINRARETGALGILAFGLSLASGGLAWLGDHVRAYAFAGEAIELLDALGFEAEPWGAASEVAAIESAMRGLHEEAQRMLERARREAERNGFDPMPPHLARAVSLCAFSRGDLDEVVRVLEDQVVRFGGVGPQFEPLGVAPLLVEAYLGLGRDDDARELAARFAKSQSGSPGPQIEAMVARCEALAAPSIDEAVAAFERSVALHVVQPDRFEMARTQLLYGMRLRRGGRRVDSRVRLEAARQAFLAMDLTLWADRAARELASTGARAQSRHGTRQALTSQETRVALLAAQGLTNREIAAALFLSPKTVEHHVGAVLRKRGLRSRTELARDVSIQNRFDRS